MDTKKRLAIATIVYWFLLLYTIAALVWWYIALEQQNQQLVTALSEQPNISEKDIALRARNKTAQYIGEGLTFLAVILIGAVFVYRAVRRQIRLQNQQENFMMAVTHELKTPVAIAKLNLETLQKRQLEDATKDRLIQATLQETIRLEMLANKVLISSQLDSKRYKPNKVELNFSDLVSKSVKDFELRFPERMWKVNIKPDVELWGDALLLEILVNNLLENAYKYSTKSSSIFSTLNEADGAVVLSIADEGCGIPREEKNKVFDKFYRIGNEQVRSAKGTGLGLYLCKRIVKDHRATIHIIDNQPSGAIFTVKFEQR